MIVTDFEAHAKVLAAALQRVLDDPVHARMYAEEALRASPQDCRQHVEDLHWIASAAAGLLRTTEGSPAEKEMRKQLEQRVRTAGLLNGTQRGFGKYEEKR